MFSVFTCPTYTCVPMLVFLKVSESTISVSYISAQGSLCWNWLTFPGAGSVNQLQLLAAFPNWRNQAAAGTWELSGCCKGRVQSPAGSCSSSRPWGWAAAPEFPAQRSCRQHKHVHRAGEPILHKEPSWVCLAGCFDHNLNTWAAFNNQLWLSVWETLPWITPQSLNVDAQTLQELAICNAIYI